MLFILKKTVGGLLMPLPFILLMMAIALVLLWMTRWQKPEKCFFTELAAVAPAEPPASG